MSPGRTTSLFRRDDDFVMLSGASLLIPDKLYRPVSPQFASFHSRDPGCRGVAFCLDAKAAGAEVPGSALILPQPKIPVETTAIAATDNIPFILLHNIFIFFSLNRLKTMLVLASLGDNSVRGNLHFRGAFSLQQVLPISEAMYSHYKYRKRGRSDG
jgi:hypothetical protein